MIKIIFFILFGIMIDELWNNPAAFFNSIAYIVKLPYNILSDIIVSVVNKPVNLIKRPVDLAVYLIKVQYEIMGYIVKIYYDIIVYIITEPYNLFNEFVDWVNNKFFKK